MHYPIERIAHTTAFITPVVEHWLEQEIAQWVHPMKDRSDDPSHQSKRSYHRATPRSHFMFNIWHNKPCNSNLPDMLRG